MAESLHATTIALGDGAVALCGPPAPASPIWPAAAGSGCRAGQRRSDPVEARGGQVIASPPDSIAGKLEVRGLGLFEMPYRSAVPLRLVVNLRPAAEIERLPEVERRLICGLQVRAIALDPASLSAPQKLRLALRDEAALIMRAASARAPSGLGPETKVNRAVSDNSSPEGGETATRAGDDALRLIVVTGMSGLDGPRPSGYWKTKVSNRSTTCPSACSMPWSERSG